jgi:DNA-directed RNA polymerase subunit M/transcription elongation factor TFIIS
MRIKCQIFLTALIVILFFAAGDCFLAMAQSVIMSCAKCGRIVWDSDSGLPKPTVCRHCGYGGNVSQDVVQQRQKAAEATALREQIAHLKTTSLEQLLGKQELDHPEYVEALTAALIAAKNRQLPGFLATATTDQKVDLLTAVESQIARASVRIDELNAEASAAIAGKQDPVPFRKRAGQIKAYINVLNEIKSILEGA